MTGYCCSSSDLQPWSATAESVAAVVARPAADEWDRITPYDKNADATGE